MFVYILCMVGEWKKVMTVVDYAFSVENVVACSMLIYASALAACGETRDSVKWWFAENENSFFFYKNFGFLVIKRAQFSYDHLLQ